MKYSKRTFPIIQSESNDDWTEYFAESLSKQSVKSKDSIYDQISSIMGTKSKFSSVEAAVEDMKERSGLNAFLKLQASKSTQKTAECEPCKEKTIFIFESCPSLKQTADNYIQSTKGNVSVPAIIDKLKTLHGKEVLKDSYWDDKNFIAYITDKNFAEKKNNPTEKTPLHLGKTHSYLQEEISAVNDDALAGLTPAK